MKIGISILQLKYITVYGMFFVSSECKYIFSIPGSERKAITKRVPNITIAYPRYTTTLNDFFPAVGFIIVERYSLNIKVEAKRKRKC